MYKIFDLHNDYFLKLKESKKDKYVNKFSNNNIISAVWTSELDIYQSMREIEKAKCYVNSNQNLLLGVEDLHFLTYENLDRFLLFRPVYAGLTWNNCNAIAGGAHEGGNLTNFGKKVVSLFEKNNIKVDTAHLNEKSFMDISKVTNKPLFCSHTAFYGVNKHCRNLKDYELKMIVDSGGLVGLCLVSDFINGKTTCNIRDVASHIDYFACKFGVDNLALGTDFYGTNHLPKDAKNYSELLINLSKCLETMGYTEKCINKIFFENANKFFA